MTAITPHSRKWKYMYIRIKAYTRLRNYKVEESESER